MTKSSNFAAVVMFTGKANCPYYAKAELLADYLQTNLPNFRVHKITQHPDKWEVRDCRTSGCQVPQCSTNQEMCLPLVRFFSSINGLLCGQRCCRSSFCYESQLEERLQCFKQLTSLSFTTGDGCKVWTSLKLYYVRKKFEIFLVGCLLAFLELFYFVFGAFLSVNGCSAYKSFAHCDYIYLQSCSLSRAFVAFKGFELQWKYEVKYHRFAYCVDGPIWVPKLQTCCL